MPGALNLPYFIVYIIIGKQVPGGTKSPLSESALALFRECVSTLYQCRVNISTKWPPYRLVQTKTHDNSCILSVGPTTMLTCNQHHGTRTLLQKSAHEYIPPGISPLNEEALYSFIIIIIVT